MAKITSLARAVGLAIASILLAGAVPATTVLPFAASDSTRSTAASTGAATSAAAWSAGQLAQPGGASAVAVRTGASVAVASETGATPQHLLPSAPTAIDGRPKPAAAAPVARPAAATTKKAAHTATVSVAPRAVPAAKVTRTTATVTLGSFGRLAIPGIGLSGSVDNWGCRGGVLPNRIERWGCAGSGNTYLMGHAFGVLRGLSTAYGAGRLRAGLVATVTTRSGTRTYRLAWARIVPASYNYRGMSGDQWAWNSTGTPSLTLQTCWGSGDRYRLIVRFVAVG